MFKFISIFAISTLVLCSGTAGAKRMPDSNSQDKLTCPGVIGFLEFDFKPIPLFLDNDCEPFDYIIFTPKEYDNGVFYELSRQSGAPLNPDYIRHGAKAADTAAFYDRLPEADTWTRTHFIPGLPYALAFRVIGYPKNGRAEIVINQESWETCEITFDSAVMEFRPWEDFLKHADEVSFTGLAVYDKPQGLELNISEDLKHGRPGQLQDDWLAVHCWDGQKEQNYWVQWKNERGLRLSKITVFVR